jgi:hypothetical protein
VGHRHDDDFEDIEAVMDGEREAAQDAFVRMRSMGPAPRRLDDFFDGGTDDMQRIIAATSTRLMVVIGTTEKYLCC